MAGGTDVDMQTCAKLFEAAPGPADADLLIAGMEKALEGRNLKEVPPALDKHLTDLWAKRPGNQTVLRFALRLGSSRAFDDALKAVEDAGLPAGDRAALIEILGQSGKNECLAPMLRLLQSETDAKLRLALLGALQPYADKRVSDAVLALYPQLAPAVRSRAQTLLLGRPASALDFLKDVDAGRVNAKDVPLDQLQRLMLFKDKEINDLIEKRWGKIGPASSGEKKSRMASIGNILRNGTGNPANGKVLFTKTCGTCHVLFGEGNKVGPELTGVDRKDLNFLLTSIVDPSAFIRPEYVAQVVVTKDGRVLTGLIVEATPKVVTLLDAKNERTVVAREQIEEMTRAPQSLMPEKLLDTMDDQEIRDLFGYLRLEGK
jgi:putative heme-binding domain-containing protein